MKRWDTFFFLTQFNESHSFQVILEVDFKSILGFREKMWKCSFLALWWYSGIFPDTPDMSHKLTKHQSKSWPWDWPVKRTQLAMAASLPFHSAPLTWSHRHCVPMVKASEPHSRSRAKQCSPYHLLLRDTQVPMKAQTLIPHIRPTEF